MGCGLLGGRTIVLIVGVNHLTNLWLCAFGRHVWATAHCDTTSTFRPVVGASSADDFHKFLGPKLQHTLVLDCLATFIIDYCTVSAVRVCYYFLELPTHHHTVTIVSTFMRLAAPRSTRALRQLVRCSRPWIKCR